MAIAELEAVAGRGIVAEEVIAVASAEDLEWDMVADVVVVGFGGAGASAALEAHERGAVVLIVERFGGGGSTANSGGVYYAGGGTRFQQDAGVQDSPEEMFRYLVQECKGAVSDATLRRFCEESVANIDWLAGHGIGFEGSLYSGKTNYPPEDKYLYYAGNEKVPAFAANAAPAARGHRTKGAGWTGYAYFDGLKRAVERLGIAVQTHSRVQRLVVDGEGSVVGCEVIEIVDPADRARHMALYAKVDPMRPFNTARAEQAIAEALAFELQVGRRRLIRARGGVILSTGGFGYNVEMVRAHMPFLADRNSALMRLGSMGCSGGGIQLGVSAGGTVGKMDHAFLGRMIAPPNALVQGIIVNRRGERFVNEDAYNALLGGAIMDQPDGDAWIIIDRDLHRMLLRQCIPTGDGTFKPYLAPALLNLFLGGTKRGRTLGELAGKIGVPAQRLEATVAELNASIAAGKDDPMGKNPDYVRPLGKGPYRALNTSVGNPYSFCIFFTLGGLSVDELRGMVLRTDGSPIDGLYAAGRAAMGLPSNGYISGLSLADGVFSGRRAGRDAALGRGNRA
jgi:3-oxo-5alpha-steroid 4-dehydrogenase